jgi:hypothetical protein
MKVEGDASETFLTWTTEYHSRALIYLVVSDWIAFFLFSVSSLHVVLAVVYDSTCDTTLL